MFDILVRNLRYGVITLGVVGVIDRAGGVLRRAVGAGEGARPLAAARGSPAPGNKAGDLGYQPNPFEEFVGAHKRALELAIAGLAVLALVVWDRPGVGAVLFLFVVALILVGFVEFLARGATPEKPSTNPLPPDRRPPGSRR